jgi:hypothetical protein
LANVTVPVLKPLEYQGRSYVRGDRIIVPVTEALALAQSRHVTLTKGAVVRRKAEPRTPTAPIPRRSYRRRDLQARVDYETTDLTPEPKS